MKKPLSLQGGASLLVFVIFDVIGFYLRWLSVDFIWLSFFNGATHFFVLPKVL